MCIVNLKKNRKNFFLYLTNFKFDFTTYMYMYMYM